jgi:hypothetical protein
MTQRDEQRVIDALRAFTGGLTVTDHDITTAESRLRDRLEPPSPRRRPLVILAVAVAAALVVVFFASQAIDRDEDSPSPAGTPPSSPADTLKAALQADAYRLTSAEFTAGAPPTARDLVGFWLLRSPYNAPIFVDTNGGWRLGDVEGAWVGTSTVDAGTWTRVIQNPGDCAPGREPVSQSWHTALAADGSLRAQLTSSNVNCTPAEDREVWDRVASGSPVGDYLLAMAQKATWQAAPGAFAREGLYVAPETGHVLQVDADGTYRYYDSLTGVEVVAADRGRLESTGDTVIGSCTGGSFSASLETTRIPGVHGYTEPRDAVRMRSTTNTCASAVADQVVWVNITP